MLRTSPELEASEPQATSAPVSPSRSLRFTDNSSRVTKKPFKSVGSSVRFLDPTPYDISDLRKSTRLGMSMKNVGDAVGKIMKPSTGTSYVDVGDDEDDEMAPAFKMLAWLDELSTDTCASELLSPEQRATALGAV